MKTEQDRLADFILNEFPGEPGRVGVPESPVDVAIRLLTDLKVIRDQRDQLAYQDVPLWRRLLELCEDPNDSMGRSAIVEALEKQAKELEDRLFDLAVEGMGEDA